ncbi:type 1 glutamine amidotransferase [Acinetobacter qingfengensis]|uniref:Protease n=1 Tax=Acinetobacter qingfengensis TaxID=1262585 RepID=A0A1E7RCM4_9GAMM|nr:type 1 glutamine amidotransferase domain-containing protein [Acinetobacter qingfengensis]KAA8735081.1 type 1 glutamine amidotransferase [Acinetobacter qingfengensis]OEY97002.1 protease [Acinetobacter qingfengensis]
MTKKALFITSNSGVEHDELIKPFEFLQSKGIESILAAIKSEDIYTVKNDTDPSTSYSPQTTLQKVTPDDYDILIIPGGTVNADQLRIDTDAQKIVQYFTDQGKPIAAICHAPWILINAERIKDKHLTSYLSIQLDLIHAGAHWHDETVHRCITNNWPLITSRNPNDIPYFNQAILDELEK